MKRAKPKPKAKPAKAAKPKPKAKPAKPAKPAKAAKPKPKAKPAKAAKPKPKAKPRQTRRAVEGVLRGKHPLNALGRRLLEALERMQDLMPGATLWVRNTPPSVSRTPWLLVARYALPGGTTYDEIFLSLYRWRDDREVGRLIGRQRASRIQARYTTDRDKEGEYTLAEIGPWGLAIARAVERIGVRDGKDDSLIERYGDGTDHQSQIDAVLVWLSASVFRDIIGTPSFHIGGRITESGDEADERVAEATPSYEHAVGFGRIGVDAPEESVEEAIPAKKTPLLDKLSEERRQKNAANEAKRLADEAKKRPRKRARGLR